MAYSYENLPTFLACLSFCMTSDERFSIRFPAMMIVSHSEVLTSVSCATHAGIWWNLLNAKTRMTNFFSCRISFGILDKWLLWRCNACKLRKKMISECQLSVKSKRQNFLYKIFLRKPPISEGLFGSAHLKLAMAQDKSETFQMHEWDKIWSELKPKFFWVQRNPK